MTFFYSDKEIRTGSFGDMSNLNAVAGYLRHYDNLMFLKFMGQKGTVLEKIQAQKEMVICERKLAWWERHPNYNQTEVLRGIDKLKSAWK